MKQRHVQLLGRSIDLNRLLAQRLGSSVLKAIDTAIHLFESKDICGIIVSNIMDEWICKWMNGYVNDGWMNEYVNGWMDEWICKWMNGYVNGWMDG